jgi:Fe-S cluster assembly protein SufD
MLETLEEIYNQQDIGSPLARFRDKSWKSFQMLGLPTKKSDPFRYFPLRKLYDGEIERSDANWQNGDVISLPLEEAFSTYSAVLEKAFLETIKRESNPFALAHLATNEHCRFLYVPPGREAEISADLHANAFLFVGRGATVTVTQTGKNNATFSGWHVFQEAASSLQFTTDLSEVSSCRLGAMRFSLKRDAKLKFFSYSQGGIGVRQDVRVDLLEENGEVDLRGLNILREKCEHHTYVHVHHAAPNCLSNQHFKSVLFDTAKTSFEGKIFVESVAQQTLAYQLNNNLILGKGSIANCKPNLEIFADDVKASHGATVTQLAPEELFYLQSRGIGEVEAKELLIHGFCAAFFNEAPEILKKYGI